MKHLREPSQVPEMSTDQLHMALVDDFVNGVHTPLPVFMAAIDALAERRRQSKEAVYQGIRQEALALGGKHNQFDIPMFS